ncbi:hypothetical protein O3G_MSEX003304 [Manduca sexta]|nr:hypothetical protein O3G_MSEX003304 [Manduca sexta]KAG6444255.1 hypothetical protein O3G_MSEX003304 [Manduca sexta]
MLMTGHTPKQKILTSKPKTPSYVVKKPSPVRKTPRGRPAKRSKENVTPIGVTPKRASTYEQTATRKSKRSSGNQSVTVLEITDSDQQNTTARASNSSRRSSQKSFQKSPRLPNPKKSALKDPKKSNRKTESIKFDLSNIENMQDSSDVLMVSNTLQQSELDESMSEDDEFTLRYSDNSSSVSPRKSIHSRSSRILEKSIGSPMSLSPNCARPSESPRGRKSLRGSLIVQKALENVSAHTSTQSFDQSTKSVPSAFKTRTLSPRPSQNMESYSIVDLVSIDSNESPRTSIYNSAESNATFDVINSTGRKTRSTIDPTLLGSSTPYIGKTGRQSVRSPNSTVCNQSQSSPEVSQLSTQANGTYVSSRRTKSLSTPENIHKHISVNSTRILRVSRNRSRLNDSDLLMIDGNESDASPKTSKRGSRASKSVLSESFNHNDQNSITSIRDDSPSQDGVTTPETRHSPQDVGTPVLNIQSLLDSSHNSFTSLNTRKGRMLQRKTIGVISENNSRTSYKSKSLNFTSRRTTSRLRQNSSEGSDKTDEGAPQPDNEETVTPKSAVKLVHEGVKNKHSTAKKPQSKRSIIDDLNQSDIVKQLFNSPVKRKLSQSMTEFSLRQLSEHDDDEILTKRPITNTTLQSSTSRTPEYSILDQTEPISPEVFVSPMNTPSGSPNLEGIKRLFGKNTPRNDLALVKGVKSLFRTPRARRSGRNDLTNVSGVKAVFAKSPRNRLSDVAVRDLFVEAPKDDLRRVSGVKSLFQSQRKNKDPKNDLSDVRGVKSLFKNSPANDLRNVSGVKKILRRNSPRNDLTDVRGVKKMFKESKKQTNDCDVSGIEELYNESNRDTDTLFDQLIGKPQIRAVYSKTFSGKSIQKAKNRKHKSLHTSIDVITNNVEEWLEKELHKRLHKDASKSNVTRELKKLATETVAGSTPIRSSRVRDSTVLKVAQGEYERKRSASEIYSAKKLPIKKRSLVEASMERSHKDEGQKSILPIKKRVVVHSTPVKGRVNLTMNASELGRVSPIAPDRTRADGPDIGMVETLEIPQNKSTSNGTRKSDDIPTNEKVSPKKTRAKSKASPPKLRTTRSRKDKTINPDKTKSRVSLVVVKKSPVKVVSRTTRNKKEATGTTTEEINKSPSNLKKTTRRQKVSENLEPKMTPKRTTRAKIQKASVIVSKPSPQLKPRSVRNVVVEKLIETSKDIKQIKEKTKTSRKTTNDSKKESPAAKRQTRAAAAIEPKTKGRKTANMKGQIQAQENPSIKRGRNTNKQNINEQELKQTAAKEKASKSKTDANNSIPEKKLKTRSKIKVVEEQKESPVKKQAVSTTRGRGKKLEPQSSVQSEPTRQVRRTKVESPVISEEKGRKRRTRLEETVPSKITRGRKKTIETTETETANGRQKRSVVKDNKVEISKSMQKGEVNKVTKITRSRRVIEEVMALQNPMEQTTRGRKRTTTVENAPDNKRSKKSKSEVSPVKEVTKKQPVRKKTNSTKASVSVVASPLKTRGKSTRGRSEPEEPKKSVGRSRRR